MAKVSMHAIYNKPLKPTSNHGELLGSDSFGSSTWRRLDGEFTTSLVYEAARGSLHVDCVTNLHFIQVLAHLSAFGELGVSVSVVNLKNANVN